MPMNYHSVMAKVSVIIPVYNLEKYLAQCLDSILSQTMDNIEILCVNDGSTDSSPVLLANYAKFDSRIKIINQQNRGLSAARNAGIEASSTDYVIFVDGDDKVAPIMVEELYRNAVLNNSDMVYANSLWFRPDRNRYFNVERGIAPHVELNFVNHPFSELTSDAELYFRLPQYAWCKIYKKSFLTYNNIYFPEGMIFEDILFFTRSYLKADRITFVNKFLYSYRLNRENSINSSGGREFFDIFKILRMSKDLFVTQGLWPKYRDRFLLFEMRTIIDKLNKIRPELKQPFSDEIKRVYSGMSLNDYDMKFLQSAQEFGQFIKILKGSPEKAGGAV